MIRIPYLVLGPLFCAAMVPAQGLLPANVQPVPSALPERSVLPASLQPAGAELASALPSPFLFEDARVQQLIGAAEIGNSVLTASALSLRLDGAHRGGVGANFTVRRLRVLIGVTDRSVSESTAVFADNLSAPLTTVFDATDYRLSTASGVVSTLPMPFGGADGSLRFPFNQTLELSIPPGGSLVFELRIEGSDAAGGVLLDGHVESPSSTVFGGETLGGSGCDNGANGPAATLEVLGQFELGSALTVAGTGYEPGTSVVTMLASEVMMPYVSLPFSGCRLFLDLGTAAPLSVRTAGLTGELLPHVPGSMLPLPRLPSLEGDLLYLQNFAPVPASGRIQTSNYRTIVVGNPGTPMVPARQIVHHQNADAEVASVTVHGSFAVRID